MPYPDDCIATISPRHPPAMKHRELVLIGCLVLFAMTSAFAIYVNARYQQTHFLPSDIPTQLLKGLQPQDIPLAAMHPPALRAMDPVRYGGSTSSLSVIEYGDYQCPACRNLHTVVKNVLPTYQGKVRLVWRDLPIEDLHDQALAAAIFARCAGQQGVYWQAHDRLMQATTLESGTLTAIAQELKLNLKTFNACRVSSTILQAVQADIDEAQADGVKSLPLIFVGTKAYEGTMDAAALKKAIDAGLSSS